MGAGTHRAHGEPRDLLTDLPFDRMQQVHYGVATDTLFRYGYRGNPPDATTSPRYFLARYDKFSTAQRKLAWSVGLGYVRCYHPGFKYDHCSARRTRSGAC